MDSARLRRRLVWSAAQTCTLRDPSPRHTHRFALASSAMLW